MSLPAYTLKYGCCSELMQRLSVCPQTQTRIVSRSFSSTLSLSLFLPPLSFISSSPSHLDFWQDTVPVLCVCTLAGDSVLGLGRFELTLCKSDPFKRLRFEHLVEDVMLDHQYHRYHKDASMSDSLSRYRHRDLRFSFRQLPLVVLQNFARCVYY